VCHALLAGVRQSYMLLRGLSYAQGLLSTGYRSVDKPRPHQQGQSRHNGASAGSQRGGSGRSSSGGAASRAEGHDVGASATGRVLGFALCAVSLSELRAFYEETLAAASPAAPFPELGSGLLDEPPPPPPHGGTHPLAQAPAQGAAEAGRRARGGGGAPPSPPSGGLRPLPGWSVGVGSMRPRALASLFLLTPAEGAQTAAGRKDSPSATAAPGAALAVEDVAGAEAADAGLMGAAGGLGLRPRPPAELQPPLAVTAQAEPQKLAAIAARRLRVDGLCVLRAAGEAAAANATRVQGTAAVFANTVLLGLCIVFYSVFGFYMIRIGEHWRAGREMAGSVLGCVLCSTRAWLM
jgi:hypothetical protein